MMKMFFLLLISPFLCCAQDAQSREDPFLFFTHQESTENLSFLVQEDAKDFIKKFSPLLNASNITNPYEIFFSYVLFSEIFKLYNVSIEKFEEALAEISNTKNIAYYRIFFQSLPSSSHPFNSLALPEFKDKYSVRLKENDKNVFSQFILGFLDVIEGINSSDESKVKNGKDLLRISAHHFCLSAAEVIYEKDQNIMKCFNYISLITRETNSKSIDKPKFPLL